MKAPPIYLIKEVTVICHNRIKASIHTKAGDIENSLIGLACTVQSYYSGGVSVEFLAYEHYGYVSDTEYLVRSIEGSDIDDFSEGWL